jgi:hypothetical protein
MYRLQYQTVNEEGAKHSINAGRPIIASFFLTA